MTTTEFAVGSENRQSVDPGLTGSVTRSGIGASHPLDDILRYGTNTDERRDRWMAYRAAVAARANERFTPVYRYRVVDKFIRRELEGYHEPSERVGASDFT